MEAALHEAKTSLSKLVARAVAGEKVILTHGKARTPVAPIVSIDAPETSVLKKRPLGLYAGQVLSHMHFSPLVLEVEHAQLGGLPANIHKDPFDRMLAAQAILEGLTLVSHDKAFDAMPVPRLWQLPRQSRNSHS
jgi:antitoxin (DNA-binding transcriptional repressor) of toxin-antitoxin stability system